MNQDQAGWAMMLRRHIAKPGWPRPVMLMAIVLVVLAGGVSLWRKVTHPKAAASVAEQSMVIQPQPFVSTISVTGTVAPGDNADVTAPFDGVVTQVGFDYGAPVTQGQVLVTLDVSDLRRRRNEAMSAFLKASQAAADIASWGTGPEVSRARRAADSAAFDLKDTQRKVEETKGLLDRGLVARSEYEGVLQQQRSQQGALASAQQDLNTALARGQGANRTVAAIDLENAKGRLAELDAQLAGAVVRAPVAGVIVRPPADRAQTQSAIHVGLPLTRGQLVGTIARSGGLAVLFHLGEIDANRVRIGQAVSVTGPGFGALALKGHVVSVAGEASPPSASSGPLTSFDAVARLDGLTPDQAAAVRIGMTANVAIEVYRNPSALVAPPASVRGAAPAATVLVRDAKSGQSHAVPVQIGKVGPDGVEILSGLKAGDVVVWTPPVTAGADGAAG
ncbi:MAG: HlyD family efflux transporter periplasmic adaptor subunit [Caulobacteraceae bacterium]|nr:HlyD family efflux transporter periplasmic adaptor subunit [Caulobacteraceae bacterium]